jgi:hypothetical protein
MLNLDYASDRQVSFIKDLLAQRAIPADLHVQDLATISKSGASLLIGRLLALPKSAPVRPAVSPAVRPSVVEGVYFKGGQVYRVKPSATGNLYAKVLVGNSFEYAPGAVRSLTLDDRMSLEQAEAFGLQFGVCVVCGRELTDAVSVARGIGPVCAKKGWW